ncbi:general substrate transporter [Kickxella alabastrina]|uniref:general substrate transporter n=1 Tax=Kickxella alabastrina TaxID=61397 RepID=UPI00221EDD50|nr:general substrate transporter [Kickxella alabastrina]KAI7827863.1 general substrate transporter [Kickxella alabastrina]
MSADISETGVPHNDSRNSPLNKPLLLSAMVAALSSINYGWVIGSVNIPSQVIEKCSGGPETWSNGFPSCIPMSSTLWGLVVGLTALGAWAGSMFSGQIADRFGRKRTLMFNNVFFVAGALLTCTATSIAQLAIGRFVSGIGCGVAANLVSTYNSEVATTRTRGFLGGFQQLMILIGLFLSQIVSIGLSTAPLWRILFSISAVLAIVQTGLLFFIPESPKFLAIKDRTDESRAALQKLRANLDITLEFNELTAMLESSRESAAMPKPSAWQILTGKTEIDLRHLVFSVLFLMMSQQWSGAKGVMFYSTEILSTTFHLTEEEIKKIPTIAQLLTLGIGGIGAVAVIIGMFILDKIGRRTVLICSSLATAICSVFIVVGSKLDIGPMVATFMYFFNLVFQCGAGFIPYLSASELLPYSVLGSISGLATSINSLTLFIVSFIFPILDKALGPYLFLPFAVTNLITFLFAVFIMPEAKGKPISEVMKEYQGPIHIANNPFASRASKRSENAAETTFYRLLDHLFSIFTNYM